MKKFLLAGCLLIAAACQPVTATPAPKSTPPAPRQTPTIPATVTQTLTPTLTFTPTLVPLYFSEEFDSDLSAWNSFVTSGDSPPQVSLQNGSLTLSFASPNTWYYAIHNAHDYSLIHVDASFDSTDSETTSLGLICMYSENGGWFEYTFSSEGTYNLLLGQWLAEGVARYTPIVYDSTEYLSLGRTDYEIGLTCEEKVLWLYIDGKLFRKLNVARYGLKEGKIGIAAAVYENVPVTAYFDWFRVSEPAK
jgi:hypothetical protein